MNANLSATATQAVDALTAVATRVEISHLAAGTVVYGFTMANNEIMDVVVSRAGRLLRATALVAEGFVRHIGTQRAIATEAVLFARWHALVAA